MDTTKYYYDPLINDCLDVELDAACIRASASAVSHSSRLSPVFVSP